MRPHGDLLGFGALQLCEVPRRLPHGKSREKTEEKNTSQ